MFSGTGNITLSWNPATDSGAGLSSAPYTYLVATDSRFTNIVASGSTGQTGQHLSLSDGAYFAKVEVRDLAGNLMSSSPVSFVIDTTAPNAPTNIVVNRGGIIDAATQTGVTITGSGGVSESGSVVRYSISSASGTVSGSGIIDAFGSFSLSLIDVSGFNDGILNYVVSITDMAGNVSSNTVGTIGKSVIPADGSLVFLSGSYSNVLATNLELSAAKPVSYSISGSGIMETITGTLMSSGSVTIPVTLVANDGNKSVQVIFTDSAEVVTTTFATIILDTTPPTLSIDSHGTGAQVAGSTVLLTGSVFDLNGIASATLNSLPLLSVSSWSKSIDLVGGNNTFTLTATDAAGNSASLPLTIERVIALSHTVLSFLPAGMRIDFDTDLASTGTVRYGTNSGALSMSQDAILSDGFHQSIVLTGLTDGALYYYTLQGISQTYSSSTSPIASFYTLKTVDVADNSSEITSTGAVVFSGASATGSTAFQGTGMLVIRNENTSTDTLAVSLSGLVITPGGTWDGIFESPKTVNLTGALLSETGYILTGSVYKAGNDATSLVLSGQTASLQIYMGNVLNGRNLHVYRSETGGMFSLIDVCTVSEGICRFQTDRFSYFAFGDPNDRTPDTFIFTPRTNVDLSTSIDSNTVILSGINTPAPISVSG